MDNIGAIKPVPTRIVKIVNVQSFDLRYSCGLVRRLRSFQEWYDALTRKLLVLT